MDGSRRTFGELLRHYRRKRYSNLQTLAAELNTSKDVLSGYENDLRIPGHKMLLELIEKLSIPPLPLLRAAGYPIDRPSFTDVQAAAEAAIMELDLSDEEKQAFIALLRVRAHPAEDRGDPPQETISVPQRRARSSS